MAQNSVIKQQTALNGLLDVKILHIYETFKEMSTTRFKFEFAVMVKIIIDTNDILK